MLLLSGNGRYDTVTIYEANSKLIRIGNAMIEEHGLKYYIVPRTSSEEPNIEQCKQLYDNLETAYEVAMQLPSNFGIEGI